MDDLSTTERSRGELLAEVARRRVWAEDPLATVANFP